MNPAIVGAGPVGLGCALELARFGVRSVLIEKHAGTSWHPKTRNHNYSPLVAACHHGAWLGPEGDAVEREQGCPAHHR
jgi:2-polyprenyl-6-methoxyphenol hydroxylase-like FAD-dependent oxidoreductase